MWAVLRSRHMRLTSVLVADHDPMQRQLLDLLFSLDGVQLQLASSGEEALAFLRERTPDAVLLATDLPDMPGTAICQKLKTVKRLAMVPVVLLAPEPLEGQGVPEEIRREARKAGADLLVPKPLGDKNLRERVERLVVAPRDDSGLSPRAVNTTAALEADGLLELAERPQAATGAGAPATELGWLRAEVARLRDENAQLKVRLTKVKARATELQQALESERRKRRGLFGRRG
jgi:CheY-like chemotaxis protein